MASPAPQTSNSVALGRETPRSVRKGQVGTTMRVPATLEAFLPVRLPYLVFSRRRNFAIRIALSCIVQMGGIGAPGASSKDASVEPSLRHLSSSTVLFDFPFGLLCSVQITMSIEFHDLVGKGIRQESVQRPSSCDSPVIRNTSLSWQHGSVRLQAAGSGPNNGSRAHPSRGGNVNPNVIGNALVTPERRPAGRNFPHEEANSGGNSRDLGGLLVLTDTDDSFQGYSPASGHNYGSGS